MYNGVRALIRKHPEAYGILRYIESHPNCSSREISEALGQVPTGLMRNLHSSGAIYRTGERTARGKYRWMIAIEIGDDDNVHGMC